MLISEISIHRPIFATVLSLMLIVVGLIGLTRLWQGIRELPNMEAPIVSVETRYRGAAPEIIETKVTQPIEHRIAGIDHIGLGGDYDGVEVLPAGLEDVSTYPVLLSALADRGWSEDDLAALTCRNVLRVMREVEDRAGELRTTRGPSLARIEDLDGLPG